MVHQTYRSCSQLIRGFWQGRCFIGQLSTKLVSDLTKPLRHVASVQSLRLFPYVVRSVEQPRVVIQCWFGIGKLMQIVVAGDTFMYIAFFFCIGRRKWHANTERPPLLMSTGSNLQSTQTLSSQRSMPERTSGTRVKQCTALVMTSRYRWRTMLYRCASCSACFSCWEPYNRFLAKIRFQRSTIPINIDPIKDLVADFDRHDDLEKAEVRETRSYRRL